MIARVEFAASWSPRFSDRDALGLTPPHLLVCGGKCCGLVFAGCDGASAHLCLRVMVVAVVVRLLLRRRIILFIEMADLRDTSRRLD